MNNTVYNPSEGGADAAKLNRFDTIMALTALVFGYFLVRLLPVFNKPVGAALFLLGLYATSFLWLRKSGIRPTVRSLAFAASGLALLPAFIINPPGAFTAFLFVFELAAYIYFIYSAPGNGIEDKVSSLFFFDALRAVFLMPSASLPALFRALPTGGSGRMKRFFRMLPWILLGLISAVIPTLIVALLLSYDESFRRIIEQIAELDLGWLVGRLFSFALGVPAAVYGYSLFVSSRSRKLADKMSGESCREAVKRVGVLPQALICATMTPVLLVYAIFFASQRGYYLSAFTGALPEGLIYSDYAREGFFQLFAVAVINILMLISASLFMKKRSVGKPITLKIYTVVTSVFTLVLIATALSKMALYIGAYGLTHKRVWASWFMLLMAAGFIFVIIGQFAEKFRFNTALLIAGFILSAAISFSNIGGIVADYNAAAYLDGRLNGVDLAEIYMTGCSGAPALLRIANEAEDTETRACAREYLALLSDSALGEYSFYEFNLPRARAAKLLESIDK